MYNKRVKRKTRKAINRSDKASCCICKSIDFLHTHHINGRDIPNADHSSNLVDLCPSCHNRLHMGEIIIERWAMSSGGMILLWHKKNENGVTGEDAKPHIIC